MSKKIVVIGALGYLGTELCKLYSGDTMIDQYDFNYQRWYYNIILNQDQKSNLRIIHP